MRGMFLRQLEGLASQWKMDPCVGQAAAYKQEINELS
jgi:hypothetical protein